MARDRGQSGSLRLWRHGWEQNSLVCLGKLSRIVAPETIRYQAAKDIVCPGTKKYSPTVGGS